MAPTTIEGERINPSRQLAKGVPGPGSPSCDELDQRRTQDTTPVNRKPSGLSHELLLAPPPTIPAAAAGSLAAAGV